jgi:hypothetical protein
MSDNDFLPEHESSLRRLVGDSEGLRYHAFRSPNEAQRADDGAVVLEGDDGGQIYMTCPARLVACPEEGLRRLLHDLDRLAWRDPDSARVFFERLPVGAGAWGGMGGGVISDGVWVHEQFAKLGLERAIRDVVQGRRARVSDPEAGT